MSQIQDGSTEECNLNVPFNDGPCTSNNIDQIGEIDKALESIFRPSSSSSEDSLKIKQLNVVNRKALLDKLLVNTNDESSYLRSFTQLIHFENDYNINQRDLEEETTIQEDMIASKVSRLLMKENRQDRMDKRKNIIMTLQNLVNDEVKYQKTFERYLNMEEQFLDEEE